MSYSHLFVLDPLIRAREDKDGVFDYYRDSLTHILANDILHIGNNGNLVIAVLISYVLWLLCTIAFCGDGCLWL